MAASSQTMVRNGELAVTDAQTSMLAQVDAALDEILQVRADAMGQPASVERSLQLAELADVEAAWWEALSEDSRTRVHWRAAQVAREHAQQAARYWRHRAAAEQVSEPVAHPLPGTAGVS